MVLIITFLVIYQAISSINSLRTFLFIFLLRRLFVNALLI
jgi:hypothetical protein